MRDIFIVAGTKIEYNFLINNAQEAWKYEIAHRLVHNVNHASELKGIEPCRVFLVGTYFKRKDWPDIDMAIRFWKHSRLLIR